MGDLLTLRAFLTQLDFDTGTFLTQLNLQEVKDDEDHRGVHSKS